MLGPVDPHTGGYPAPLEFEAETVVEDTDGRCRLFREMLQSPKNLIATLQREDVAGIWAEDGKTGGKVLRIPAKLAERSRVIVP